MDAIKKKMQAIKQEKDAAMDKVSFRNNHPFFSFLTLQIL